VLAYGGNKNILEEAEYKLDDENKIKPILKVKYNYNEEGKETESFYYRNQIKMDDYIYSLTSYNNNGFTKELFYVSKEKTLLGYTYLYDKHGNELEMIIYGKHKNPKREYKNIYEYY